MLEARDIAFAYGDVSILRGVSFVASPGEIVSVVGANGAGKTTLMRILSTLTTSDSGSVLLDGKDIAAKPLVYRRHVGYLPERIALYEDMSARDYLVYRAKLKGEPSKRIRRRLSEASDMCGLSPILGRRICGLSAGQKKRVALADAIMLRPRILLLDDLLSGLDVDMRKSMGEILSAMAAFASVVATGHEISDMAKWTTRFLVLRGGTISAAIPAAGADAAALAARVESALSGEAGA